jgi:prepilin-type processing-associated H-X9-DG protein
MPVVYLYSYLSLPSPASLPSVNALQNSTPIFTCPATIKIAVSGVLNGNRVTYSTRGQIVPGTEVSRPFGYPAGTTPAVAGAPYHPMKLLSILQYTNSLTDCYAMRDVDMEVDNGGSVSWYTQISPTAVHGKNIRNVIFFDWHAQSAHGTNFLE